MMPFVAILSTIDTVPLSAFLAPSMSLASSDGANRLERGPELRSQLTAVRAALDVLAVRLEGGFRTLGHYPRVLVCPAHLTGGVLTKYAILARYVRPRNRAQGGPGVASS